MGFSDLRYPVEHMAAKLLHTSFQLIFRSVFYFTDFANVWQDSLEDLNLSKEFILWLTYSCYFFSLRIELLHFGGLFFFFIRSLFYLMSYERKLFETRLMCAWPSDCGVSIKRPEHTNSYFYNFSFPLWLTHNWFSLCWLSLPRFFLLCVLIKGGVFLEQSTKHTKKSHLKMFKALFYTM